MSWHVEAPVWEAYATGRLDPATEASVDSHVSACAQCQLAARGHVATGASEAVWAEVRLQVHSAPLPAPLRLAQRLGVRPDDLVVVSAADSLLLPWALAVGMAVACACIVGLAGLGPLNQHTVFLAMAPLAPVLAVVASYDAVDPLREVTVTTPYSKLRLALLRASAALAVALPATLAIGLLVPDLRDLTFVWLLPSLGLTLAGLVALTWLDASRSGALIGTAWLTLVLLLRADDRVDLLTSSTAQAGCVAAAILMALAFVLRTSTLRLQRGFR
jgi:hypothetical protein